MKRLLSVGVMVGLLVTGASISWAETSVKSSKSDGSDRVGTKAGDQAKGPSQRPRLRRKTRARASRMIRTNMRSVRTLRSPLV